MNIKGTLLEGLFYDHVKEQLLWVDILDHNIYRYDVKTKHLEKISSPVKYPSVIIPCLNSDKYLIAAWNEIFLFDFKDTKIKTIATINNINNRFNDGKCDINGNLYIGTTNLKDIPNQAHLYKLFQNKLDRIKSNISISNGIGWSPDGKIMYYIDTPQKSIEVIELNQTSFISGKTSFIDLSLYDGVPDGLTVDTKGHIWVAMWDGKQILEVDPSIGVINQIKLPVSRPTTCVFGNPNQLFVSTAYVKGEFLSGNILTITLNSQTEISGIKGNYFNPVLNLN